MGIASGIECQECISPHPWEHCRGNDFCFSALFCVARGRAKSQVFPTWVLPSHGSKGCKEKLSVYLISGWGEK